MKPKTMMGRKNLLLVWTPQLCYTDCCQILHHFQSYRYVNFFILQSVKSWITLSTRQIAIQRISIMKTNCTIRWIVIYPVDNAIHLSNNRGQLDSAIQSLNNQASPLSSKSIKEKTHSWGLVQV